MIALTINGKKVELNIDPQMPLLWAIRDHAGLTGTKFGCGMALCGACTVHINGAPVRSCVTPVSSVAGSSIITIEGLMESKVGRAVQEAWIAESVAQCGYCQSGQIMSATALLADNQNPSDADINTAMSGNICRCGTYLRIRSAIKRAASKLAAPATQSTSL